MNITQFCPARLRLSGVGPFQDGHTEIVEFTNTDGRLANATLLVSANGKGKTTVLDAVAHLCALLDVVDGNFSDGPWGLTADDAHMLQLDVRVEVRDSEEPEGILLSLIDGAGPVPLYSLLTGEQLAALDATRQVVFGVARTETGARLMVHPVDDPWLARLTSALSQARSRTVEGPAAAEPAETAPSLLYFTAYRNLIRLGALDERDISRPVGWQQRVVRVIDREDRWTASLDKLFVWLYWLEDGERGRFSLARDAANNLVFEGTSKRLVSVRKDPPEMLVQVDGHFHRLDQLSSGEKNLLQLFVRISVFSTRNTILVIDEVDVHLHPRWEHWVVQALKRIVARNPGTSVILTAHSMEIIRAFAVEVAEPGIVKTAHVIGDGLE